MKGEFNGWKSENRQLVLDAQNILTRYGIDFEDHPANIVQGVPNYGHSIEYARKILHHLEAVIVEDVTFFNYDIKAMFNYNYREIIKRLNLLKPFMNGENGSLRNVPWPDQI